MNKLTSHSTFDEVKYQFFLSSTYEDLKDERNKAIETILRSYNFPIGMEMFNANDKKSWEIIKSNIDTSDVYLLIIGHRYGSTTKDRVPISFTEKEFRYALARKRKGLLKVLCFIRERDYNHLRADQIEFSDAGKKELVRFINDVKNSNCNVGWFTTADDLSGKVSDAVNKALRSLNDVSNPQGGWVRRKPELSKLVNADQSSIYGMPHLKDFLRKRALEFVVINSDRETYLFDDNGNCEIETERSQQIKSEATHCLNGYTNESPGQFKILEIVEMSPGTILTTPVILDQNTSAFSFCILYEKCPPKDSILRYRFKVRVENYISKLLTDKTTTMHFDSLPNITFSKKTDVLIFPNKRIYKNLSVHLVQVYHNQIINEEIPADLTDPKKKKFIIDYGSINANYNIILELKLNK